MISSVQQKFMVQAPSVPNTSSKTVLASSLYNSNQDAFYVSPNSIIFSRQTPQIAPESSNQSKAAVRSKPHTSADQSQSSVPPDSGYFNMDEARLTLMSVETTILSRQILTDFTRRFLNRVIKQKVGDTNELSPPSHSNSPPSNHRTPNSSSPTSNPSTQRISDKSVGISKDDLKRIPEIMPEVPQQYQEELSHFCPDCKDLAKIVLWRNVKELDSRYECRFRIADASRSKCFLQCNSPHPPK